jgi:SAM-dependent methyltransferase
MNVCIICNSQKISKPIQIENHLDNSDFFQLYKCKSCLYEKLDPVPIDLTKYYENVAGEIMHKNPKRYQHFARNIRMKLETQALSNLAEKRPNLSLLDIGCGDGDLIELLKKRFNVSGCDIYPETQWSKHLPYTQLKNLINIDFENEFKNIDIITMRHVLEHVPDPNKFIKNMKKSNIEYIFVIVPNSRSKTRKLFGKYWYYLDPPRHISQFNEINLRKLLSEDWNVISIEYYGLDEIICSIWRYILIKYNKDITYLRPMGILSSLLSASVTFINKTTIIMLAQRKK